MTISRFIHAAADCTVLLFYMDIYLKIKRTLLL